jgi:hypothetical protein
MRNVGSLFNAFALRQRIYFGVRRSPFTVHRSAFTVRRFGFVGGAGKMRGHPSSEGVWWSVFIDACDI